MAKRNVLVVAAHPDDETLGCGGSIAVHTSRGDRVHVLFLTDGVSARNSQQQAEEAAARQANSRAALATLGVSDATFLRLPDNKLDTRPLLEIVQEIEPVVKATEPEVVYTHHFGDLNVDHRLAHQAVMTALRPQPSRPKPTILCFEIASSTEWQTAVPHLSFLPNWFQDVSGHLDQKLAALRNYKQEVRAWPHSRSEEALLHLARWRGACVGVPAAEAFTMVRCVQS